MRATELVDSTVCHGLNALAQLVVMATRRYEIIRVLGFGAYGEVYLAKDRETGDQRAIKRFKRRCEDDLDLSLPADLLREISILKSLDHPNIVAVMDVHMERGPPEVDPPPVNSRREVRRGCHADAWGLCDWSSSRALPWLCR